MNKYYIGTIKEIKPNLTAAIMILDGVILEDCRYLGPHVTEVKENDQVLVCCLSKDVFLYKILTLDEFIGVKNGESMIDVSQPDKIVVKTNNLTIESDKITLKGDVVTINSDDIKLGGEYASFSPLCVEDVSNIIAPSSGGPCSIVPGTKITKIKLKG